MKNFKSILFTLLMIISLVSVSCSNDSGQKETTDSSITARAGDVIIVGKDISSTDVNRPMLIEYAYYALDKYTIRDTKGVIIKFEYNNDDVDTYFTASDINRAHVVCHPHPAFYDPESGITIYEVVVQADNGYYYTVSVGSHAGQDNVVVDMVWHGLLNPCK
jgi:hypothetical protein